ncbi:hypothetical protein MesoLj131c_41930 [Mesorhizobium sp. 131-3-5]|nr:hypothetical protein MesoLj131c_41930 [Mesorhizobium sp. 131-3-5]
MSWNVNVPELATTVRTSVPVLKFALMIVGEAPPVPKAASSIPLVGAAGFEPAFMPAIFAWNPLSWLLAIDEPVRSSSPPLLELKVMTSPLATVPSSRRIAPLLIFSPVAPAPMFVVISSVPPAAVIVPVPLFAIGPVTVPKPVSIAPLPIVSPEASVSVPPSN